jgi:uncharacterized protein (TIGR02996 family)
MTDDKPLTEEDALWAEIGSRPDDSLPRLVLADWYDENAGTVKCEECKPPHNFWPACPQCHGWRFTPDGRADLAAALRSTADRVPLCDDDGGGGWMWFSEATNGNHRIHPESDLPHDVVDRLLAGERLGYSGRLYDTAADAIRDLCRAWIACKLEVPT